MTPLRLKAIHAIADRCARRGDAKMIHLDGKPYLERYVLRGGLKQDGDKVNVYLHRFHQPDDDRGPHCHPWRWSASLILWGGYVETRVVEAPGVCVETVERTFREGMINAIDMTAFHRVAKLLPRDGEVWTLFTTGPKHSLSWGYLVDGKYVPKSTCGGCRGCEHGFVSCAGNKNPITGDELRRILRKYEVGPAYVCDIDTSAMWLRRGPGQTAVRLDNVRFASMSAFEFENKLRKELSK